MPPKKLPITTKGDNKKTTEATTKGDGKNSAATKTGKTKKKKSTTTRVGKTKGAAGDQTVTTTKTETATGHKVTSVVTAAKPPAPAPAPAPTRQWAADEEVWTVKLADMMRAIELATADGKAPLILDHLDDHPAETFFGYQSCFVVDAKELIGKVYVAKEPIAEHHEALRKKLIGAMTTGFTLWVRLANAAPTFLKQEDDPDGAKCFCHPDKFPESTFALAKGAKADGEEMCYPSVFLDKEWIEKNTTKEERDELSVSMLTGRSDAFQLVLTSAFELEDYKEFLEAGLPVGSMQVIDIVRE